jgi:hypothetical protein
MSDDQRWKRVKAHLKKGDDHLVAAGLILKELKAEHEQAGGTWDQWETLVKEKAGIAKSRASELMQIADGRKTVEGTRQEARERMKEVRARSPERSGEIWECPSGEHEIRMPCNCGVAPQRWFHIFDDHGGSMGFFPTGIFARKRVEPTLSPTLS